MRRNPARPFLTLLTGMALTGAALIWSIPPLFRSPEPYQDWTTGVLGGPLRGPRHGRAVPAADGTAATRAEGRRVT
jgi:hypothetical protein